jgi:iron complex outermembrane recepter protein
MSTNAPRRARHLRTGLHLSVLAAAASSLPAAAQGVDAIEVVGRRQGGAYEAGDVSGTKSSLPLRELPQSVRVLPRQALDDLGAVRLDEVLDYVGGVSRQNHFGGLWDNIAIRGLAGNENTGMAMLLNGLAGNRGFNAPRDLVDVERVEFLKGPAAALYGASEPGGSINLVTKKPLWKAATAAELYVGSYDFHRLTLDSTGPLGDALAYRLNVALEDRGSFRDHVDAQRAVVAPAATWRLGRSTTLDYSGQWLRHRTPLDRGVQAIGNDLGAVPRERFPGEPADGRVTVDNHSHQVVLDHDLHTDWRARLALSWRQGTLDGVSTEPSSLRADNRTLWRQRRDRDYASRDLALQAELAGRVRAGAATHELLLGAEAYRFTLDQLMLRVNPNAAAPYALDLLAPVYGQTPPTPLPNTNTQERQRGVALTLQDAMSLGPAWRVVAGVRIDRVAQALDNRRNGRRSEQSPTEASPRIGMSYLPSPQWTLFANAGRSFRANAGSDARGRAFDPESGRALEGGVKWERADRRLGVTLTVFDILKRNVLTGDPANAGFSVATGEVGSRGAELDLSGQLTRHLRITGSLASYDVAVRRDNLLAVDGPVLNAPSLNGSLLAVYEAALPGGGTFGVGGGVTHSSRRLGQAYTQAEANAGTAAFWLPAYTTAKLVAHWRISPSLRASLDVDNLFDKTHYTSSFSRVWVTPGAARSVTLGLQARF